MPLLSRVIEANPCTEFNLRRRGTSRIASGSPGDRTGYVSRMVVELREVTTNDLPVLYEQQLDSEATAMAAFPSRDRAAFMAHWRRILIEPEVIVRVAVADGRVAGYVSCFELD